MIIVNDFEQGDPAWHKARVGNPGATGISNVITSAGQPSESREKYLYQMAEEILTGEKPETFQSYVMLRGTELEPKARALFAYTMGLDVQECAMIYPDDSRRWHVSPDGIMPPREEGLEIKCPSLQVHHKYLNAGVCPTEYRLQVQGSLAVTGYKRWWFVSFFPEVKTLIIPVKRDEKLISIILAEMDRFITDLDRLVAQLRA